MRLSAIPLTLAAVSLAAVAAATGFFAGRASVSDHQDTVIAERPRDTATVPLNVRPAARQTVPSNPRADLVRALEQPEPERARAVRLAMNTWLARDGAAAIMAARDDPELADVTDRLTQLALYVYPEIIVDSPELLEGIPEETLAMVVSGIALFNPDAARSLIGTHFSNSMYGEAMLSMVDQIGRRDFALQPVEDPRAELEAILAERGMMKRVPRLYKLVVRVATDDPLAAAALIDDLPGSLMNHAIQALTEVWSKTNPEEAARWLAKKNAQVSGQGLSEVARRWGESDFEAANAFGDTLTDARRTAFLNGLASATHRLSKAEVLAWVSRYEDDPAYPNLIMNAALRLVRDSADDAIALVETLPAQARAPFYSSVLSSVAFENPEAALALVDDIGDEAVRGQVLPMVSQIWAENDAESALDWALGLERGAVRDRAIASASGSLMGFDMDRAVDAIAEIDDPEVRKEPVWRLLSTVESDAEAIRLGRDYGFDRDTVLEVREQRHGILGRFAPFSTFGSIRIAGFASEDADEE